MPEPSLATAARLGLAVDAAERGNNGLLVDMLMSIPVDELEAAVARLNLLGLPGLRELLAL